MTTPSYQSIEQLRSSIKQQRQALSKQTQKNAANAFCEFALNWPVFKEAKHIGLYYPVRGELDVFSLYQLKPSNKHFYLPVIQDDNTLTFTEINDDTQWQINKYGIQEPIAKTLTFAKDLDLVFCPLVAFDKNNHRIGQGGGYYDRSFAFKINNPQQKPFLAGAAYHFQSIDTITPNKWDVKMNFVFHNSP